MDTQFENDAPVKKTGKYKGRSLTIRNYSERSIVLYGEDSKEMTEDLGRNGLGGAYNPRLKHPLYPEQKLKGWVFPMSKKASVIDFCIMQDINYKDVDSK